MKDDDYKLNLIYIVNLQNSPKYFGIKCPVPFLYVSLLVTQHESKLFLHKTIVNTCTITSFQ